jgi:ATP synthase protein I
MPFRFGESNALAVRSIGALLTVGFAFVIAIVLGFWIGRTLDTWIGSSPWFTLIFFFLGLAAGMLNVFRTMKAVGRDTDRS